MAKKKPVPEKKAAKKKPAKKRGKKRVTTVTCAQLERWARKAQQFQMAVLKELARARRMPGKKIMLSAAMLRAFPSIIVGDECGCLIGG